MNNLFIYVVRVYQKLIRPYITSSCRYYPSCSEYSVEALSTFGVLRGSLLSILRVLRCNPFFPGGYDPIHKEVKK